MMKRKKVKKHFRSLNTAFIAFSFLIFLFSLGLALIIKQNFCANSISCVGDLSGKFDYQSEGVFMGRKVSSPILAELPSVKQILGEETASNKHIYVDLSSQHLYAKEGNNTVLDFPISSGKWYPTPTGEFRIWIKLRYTRMSGGNKAFGTYYNLPNVPYTMYFYNDQYPKHIGYGLHGAYWHNNFGHPMSHGCVNISPENAGKLFEWADPASTGWGTKATDENPGTPVTIYGETPKE